MKRDFRKVGWYLAALIGGYVCAELLIYAALPHWKWKSADLLFGMLVLVSGMAVVKEKAAFLRRTLFMSLLLMMPIFIGMLAGQPLHMAMQYRTLAFSLIGAAGFFTVQSFLPVGRWRTIFSRAFYSAVFLVSLTLWGYYFSAGSLLNASAILAIFQTNPAEAKSYLLDYMPWQGVCILILLIAAYVRFLRHWTQSLNVHWGGTAVLAYI